MLANSHGFLGEFQRSYCSVSAVPIARDEQGKMQRDYWYSVSRTMGKLESAESVGQTAAKRTLRRLGARKVKTARVPVIFDPQVARSLLGHIFEAANGESIYRNASFLTGKLGEQIAGENVHRDRRRHHSVAASAAARSTARACRRGARSWSRTACSSRIC